MSKNKHITLKTYKGYPINNGKNREFSCNTKTLDQGIEMIEYMTKNHSKVQCYRGDIRTPQEANIKIRDKMPKIMEGIKRKLESELRHSPNKVDMQYVCRIEQSKNGKEHAHLFIMTNGNAVQNSWRIQRIANEVVKAKFETQKNGLVHFSESNGKYGKRIDRNSPDFAKQKDEAVYAMSYLAKARPSDKKAKNAKISSASRLPKK